MESTAPCTNAEPDRQSARAALADVQAARHAIASSVTYPPLYRPLMAFSGAAIPLLMVSGSDGIPSTFLGGLLLVIGVLGVAASGWALQTFESSNGVRITGLRTGKRLSVAYLTSTLLLLIAVAAISHASDAWWVALIAAPISASFAIIYSNAWLADYQRHAA